MLWHSAGISEVRICGVRRYESVRLRGHWGENALLMKANTVGTSPVWRRVEAMASDLQDDQFLSTERAFANKLTFRRLQYLQAIAVRCRGAGWLKFI